MSDELRDEDFTIIGTEDAEPRKGKVRVPIMFEMKPSKRNVPVKKNKNKQVPPMAVFIRMLRH